MTATAVFTIWPHLLFFAGWSAMVCCVNKFTEAELVVPNTLLTALGKWTSLQTRRTVLTVRCFAGFDTQL